MSTNQIVWRMRLVLFLAVWSSVSPVNAQDPRVSLYESIPLLVNPALTGDVKQPVRVSLLGSRVSTERLSNRIMNVGVDAALGKKKNLGIGVNFMQSGSPHFLMSGSYAGVSLAQRFYLDQQKIHQIRFGAQVSLLRGAMDASKGGYDKYLDVRAFRYWVGTNARSGVKASGHYLNYSIGAYYRYEIPGLTLESGFSAYNITNPLGHNLLPGSPVRKRYRAASLVSFTFNYNPANSFRFQTLSWYEGLYLREYMPKRDDTTHIHENTYSLTWYRLKPKRPYSIGLYTRSLKSVYAVTGVQLSPSVRVALSYEMPFYAKYYGVHHWEVGATIFPLKNKKGKAITEPAFDPVQQWLQPCPCIGAVRPDSSNSMTKEAKPPLALADTVYKLVHQTDTVYKVVRTTDTVYIRVPYSDTVRVPVAATSQPVVLKPIVEKEQKDTVAVVRKKDTDKDGVPDEEDKCPNARGTLSNQGCPADVEILEGARATYIIYFDYDKSVLKPVSVTELKLVMAELRRHPGARVVLTGHTDLNGSDDYNMRLSKRRVDAAAAYLEANGFKSEIQSTSFLGKRQPKFNDNTQAHAAINRRVEISLIY